MKQRCKRMAACAILLANVSQLAACATPEQSRLTGQVVGTAIGIAAGAQFGQGLGTAFAAAHGAWFGFNLGGWTVESWPTTAQTH
jgi:uncharacterized protein YcfJ